MFGIKRLASGRYEVAVGYAIHVVPTLGDAIRLRLESFFL